MGIVAFMEPIKKPKNISLIIGLAIPVLMIVAVAGSIYVPRFFAPAPQYDFLYMSEHYGGPYDSRTYYEVRNGRVVKNPPVPVVQEPTPYPDQKIVKGPEPRLFRYEVKSETSREMTLQEAQNLTLTTDKKSPDGFEYRDGSRGGEFFPFGGGYDYDTKYLTGHGTSRKLTISGDRYGYAPIRFLGWIKH